MCSLLVSCPVFLNFFSTSSLEMDECSTHFENTLLTSTGLSTVIDSSLDTNPSILDGRWFDSCDYGRRDILVSGLSRCRVRSLHTQR